MNLQQVKEYFEKNTNCEPVTIRGSELIADPHKTSLSLIGFLEANSGNKGYLPYWDTLSLIYKEVYKNNTSK